jgi:hypothetical protein
MSHGYEHEPTRSAPVSELSAIYFSFNRMVAEFAGTEDFTETRPFFLQKPNKRLEARVGIERESPFWLLHHYRLTTRATQPHN